MNLVYLRYPFPDNGFVNRMDHFHSLLDFEYRIRERQDPPRVFASWSYVEIFAISPPRREEALTCTGIAPVFCGSYVFITFFLFWTRL